MTFEELKAACAQGDTVLLHLDRLPTGEKIRLVRSGGPLGEVICCPSHGGTTARFKSAAVLRWVAKAEAICGDYE